MTRVKICGITRMEDAQHAAACGAEMLGFNFYGQSPRYIAPEVAAKIVASLPANVECVGLFVNEASTEQVRRIAEIAGVRSVQLHGDESPEFCAALMDLNPIKAIRVTGEEVIAEVAQFAGTRILLDAPSQSFGGSGKTFDWNVAKKIREHCDYVMLAGGLDAANVVFAVRTVAPDAVDAVSRLESSPGIKDHDKVAKFIAMAHSVKSAAAAMDRK